MEHRSSRRIKINIPFLINCIIIIRVNKTNTNEKLITLPSDVRLSKILTGNELGLLGGLPKLPISEEIENFVKSLIDRTPDTSLHSVAWADLAESWETERQEMLEYESEGGLSDEECVGIKNILKRC